MSKKRVTKQHSVLLNNDSKNSFEHVITCLMEICNHNYYQAGQCATIVHNTGKCVIYNSSKEDCQEIHELLSDEGLNTELIRTVKNS